MELVRRATKIFLAQGDFGQDLKKNGFVIFQNELLVGLHNFQLF